MSSFNLMVRSSSGNTEAENCAMDKVVESFLDFANGVGQAPAPPVFDFCDLSAVRSEEFGESLDERFLAFFLDFRADNQCDFIVVQAAGSPFFGFAPGSWFFQEQKERGLTRQRPRYESA